MKLTCILAATLATAGAFAQQRVELNPAATIRDASRFDVENPVDDLHATMLECRGRDHTKLLTHVHGKVVKGLPARPATYADRSRSSSDCINSRTCNDSAVAPAAPTPSGAIGGSTRK